MKAAPVLVRVLRDPERLRHLSLAEWDLLLRQARASQLIARIALLAQRHAPDAIAPQVAPHFEGALLVAQRHREAVEWEITQIRQALDSVGLPLILLKGAAYLAAGVPAASGRSFADIDILVPRARINQAEAALMMHGWATSHHSAYDDRYYRAWMHELPPMQHGRRMTVVDVHHAILPATASSKPDSARLIAAARALPERPGVLVLAPVDMVIHSACHLFHEEELEKGLRDLSDLDLLLRDFAALPGFWQELPARASELDLERAVFYALRFSSQLLGTPVPPATLEAAARFAPAPPTMHLMDALYGRALLPHHPSCDDGFSALARRLLFMRAHWLRMPPGLLARHLAHKAAVAIKGDE
ncbi:MAG TPA: nucleotidyltransferase family protein [Noviherbaspirillum sp.]